MHDGNYIMKEIKIKIKKFNGFFWFSVSFIKLNEEAKKSEGIIFSRFFS